MDSAIEMMSGVFQWWWGSASGPSGEIEMKEFSPRAEEKLTDEEHSDRGLGTESQRLVNDNQARPRRRNEQLEAEVASTTEVLQERLSLKEDENRDLHQQVRELRTGLEESSRLLLKCESFLQQKAKMKRQLQNAQLREKAEAEVRKRKETTRKKATDVESFGYGLHMALLELERKSLQREGMALEQEEAMEEKLRDNFRLVEDMKARLETILSQYCLEDEEPEPEGGQSVRRVRFSSEVSVRIIPRKEKPEVA